MKMSRAILFLVALETGRDIGSSRPAFHMGHHSPRLVHHAHAELTELEAEIDVFVVHRHEALVVAADRGEEISPHHERCRRAVVNLSAVVVRRSFWIVTTTVVAPGPVAPDDGPCLVETAVGVEVLRRNGGDV